MSTTQLGEKKSTPAAAPSFAFIARAVQAHMESQPAPVPFVYGKTRIPLNVPTYGAEEVIEALDSLTSGWVTMGGKVRAFEQLWAEYIGVKHAVMTNSGSSANLLALSTLGLQPGDEVITPALTWATTVFPIAQVGALPVLVDVDLGTYNLTPDAVERAITPRTRAIMPVHLLGNPCEMDALRYIASRHSLHLLEDACEAHGAEYHGHKVGSLGDAATFSFFFSHHISTIEGGMIVTNDDVTAELCRSLRVFGWIRDLQDREALGKNYPLIDPRFLFIHPGYNFRPTEVQGAFGIHQVPRLEGYIAQRRENAVYWSSALGGLAEHLIVPQERHGTRHAWFAYPVLVRPGAPFSRRELCAYLEERGVETRPIEAGNMAVQPAMRHVPHRCDGKLPNAQLIHDNSFFWGNHAGITPVLREAVVDYIREFTGRFG